MIPPNSSREELERLYLHLLGAVVHLAKILGKPCPIVTRKERRERA